jgi:nicotinamide mononucleotide (NMN) deamidase PncC
MAEMIPCSASYVASALSDDKGKLDAYNRGVVAYKAKQFFSIYEKIQQEKRKLFSSQ